MKILIWFEAVATHNFRNVIARMVTIVLFLTDFTQLLLFFSWVQSLQIKPPVGT
jgi:hypothetical protein